MFINDTGKTYVHGTKYSKDQPSADKEVIDLDQVDYLPAAKTGEKKNGNEKLETVPFFKLVSILKYFGVFSYY